MGYATDSTVGGTVAILGMAGLLGQNEAQYLPHLCHQSGVAMTLYSLGMKRTE